MQLTPRYDGPPVLRVEGPIPDPATTLVRQRRRLATVLSSLPSDRWTAPTRCSEWTVRQVVAHLVDTDRFWAFSIQAASAGSPTRFLETFDPVTSPPALAEAHAGLATAELLELLRAGSSALGDLLAGLDADGWEALAEAPPGHIPIRALALHALWDGWVHERDIVLPLGLTPVEDDDEVRSCLLYAAALGPAFAACGGATRTGTLVVVTTDPATRVVVRIAPDVTASLAPSDESVPSDAVVLDGDAVTLVEALSLRTPFPHPLGLDDRWSLGTLATVFDQD